MSTKIIKNCPIYCLFQVCCDLCCSVLYNGPCRPLGIPTKAQLGIVLHLEGFEPVSFVCPVLCYTMGLYPHLRRTGRMRRMRTTMHQASLESCAAEILNTQEKKKHNQREKILKDHTSPPPGQFHVGQFSTCRYQSWACVFFYTSPRNEGIPVVRRQDRTISILWSINTGATDPYLVLEQEEGRLIQPGCPLWRPKRPIIIPLDNPLLMTRCRGKKLLVPSSG